MRAPQAVHEHSISRRKRDLFRLPILLLAVGGLVLGACRPKPQAPVAPVVPVTVAKVVVKAMPVELQEVGTVEAVSSVNIRSQVTGELVAVHFEEGDDVTRGQLLFTIDPSSYRATLDQAKAQLARDEALATNAQQDADRYAGLVKKEFVTQEQYEEKRSQAASLKASVLADKAAVERAQLDLDHTAIRSPINGRTGSLLVHAGNQVKANDATLVTIYQMEPIRARFSVPQNYLNVVRQRAAGRKLAVTALASGPDNKQEDGTLSFIDSSVDPQTGTVMLKATFPNHDRTLWPGEFVNVSLDLMTQAGAVVVPSAAVQDGQQGKYVFIVKPNDTVDSVDISVDRVVGQETVVAKGLKGDETVVTDGQLRLVPGSKISIKQPSAAETPSATGEEEGS